MTAALALLAVPAALAPAAQAYAAQAQAPATTRAYASQLRAYRAWAAANAPEGALAPASVAAYLAHRADRGASVATMAQALAAIAALALEAGAPNPRGHRLVAVTWKGIKRARAGQRQRQARALLPAALPGMLASTSARDRALVLLGFATGCRRSELVALDVGDVAWDDLGVRITIRRSKTDQIGAGRVVGVPWGARAETCPVRALKAHLANATGGQNSPVFSSTRAGRRLDGRDVARIVQRLAPGQQLSGHSLRAGLVTAAARAGKPAHAIMRQTGHRSLAMVQRYVREAQVFEDNCVAGLL